MGVRRRVLSAAITLVLAPAATAAEPPEQVLATFGLRADGQTWVLPEHDRLRRLLQRFEGQLRTFHKTEQVWREQIEQFDSLEKQLQQLESRFEESRRLLQQQSGNLVVQQQLQEQRGKLSQRIGELRLALKKRQNAEESDLYEASRRHAAARAELLLTAATVDETHRRLTERYKSLSGSAAVQAALSDLQTGKGDDQSLASIVSQSQDVEAALRRAAKVLEGGELPVLLSAGHVQIDVLAAGKPATFTLDEDRPQTLVPVSHASRLGIDLGEAALWQTLAYGDRKIRLCSARLDILNIGGVTLRDVDVYVTSAEDADLGLRLGSDVLDQLDLQIDRGRARIEVRPSTSRTSARR